MRITIGHLRRIIREVVEDQMGVKGASPTEKHEMVLKFSGEDNDLWEDHVRDYFMDMGVGGQAKGLRVQSFSHWSDQDFEDVIQQIDQIHGYI